jgi:hypothetical protein
MTKYAQINEQGTVITVIVAGQEFIDSGVVGNPNTWIQTTEDHNNPTKNIVGIGYTYDSVLGTFTPPKPYNSWLLSEDTNQWYAPVDYPTDGKLYSWDEETISWVEIIPPQPEIVESQE